MSNFAVHFTFRETSEFKLDQPSAATRCIDREESTFTRYSVPTPTDADRTLRAIRENKIPFFDTHTLKHFAPSCFVQDLTQLCHILDAPELMCPTFISMLAVQRLEELLQQKRPRVIKHEGINSDEDTLTAYYPNPKQRRDNDTTSWTRNNDRDHPCTSMVNMTLPEVLPCDVVPHKGDITLFSSLYLKEDAVGGSAQNAKRPKVDPRTLLKPVAFYQILPSGAPSVSTASFLHCCPTVSFGRGNRSPSTSTTFGPYFDLSPSLLALPNHKDLRRQVSRFHGQVVFQPDKKTFTLLNYGVCGVLVVDRSGESKKVFAGVVQLSDGDKVTVGPITFSFHLVVGGEE